MNDRGLVSSLFDLSFTHFITPKIQKFLYGLLLLFSGIAGIGVLVTAMGMGSGFFGTLGALLIGVPLAVLCALLLAMYFRVMMEILIVVFRGVDYLAQIAESVKGNPGAPR
jgi:hypothetical protein